MNRGTQSWSTIVISSVGNAGSQSLCYWVTTSKVNTRYDNQMMINYMLNDNNIDSNLNNQHNSCTYTNNIIHKDNVIKTCHHYKKVTLIILITVQ